MSDSVIKHVLYKSLFKSVIPFLDCWRTEGGGVATFMASPYAPLKEWLSRTMKQPGSLSFNTEIAAQREALMSAGTCCFVVVVVLYLL